MSLTDQDARALAHLARRLREDTYGAGAWDTPGIWSEVSALVGQDLAVSIERVVRHAADPEARTPGAIRRPYTPGPPEPKRPRDIAPVGSRCTTCGLAAGECRSRWSRDHEFTRPHERDVDLSGTIAELKGHIAHPGPTTEQRPHTPNPHAATARALLHADPTPEGTTTHPIPESEARRG